VNAKITRPKTYINKAPRHGFAHAPRKMPASTILRILATPPEAEWFRSRRDVFPLERARIAANPTNISYRKYSTMGRIFRQATDEELIAALDEAISWEQRCDVLRILTWREATIVVPNVAKYMGSLVTQERICAARFIQQVCGGKEHICDPDLVTMANLGLSPE
jgi:hypothetical protein